MNEYTIEQLEQLVFGASCPYAKSTAFVWALDYVKEHDTALYKKLLLKEVCEMGLDLDE